MKATKVFIICLNQFKRMEHSYSLEFESFINYESILCSFFPGTKIVNSACIGVHFTPLHKVFMYLYPDTDTQRNLETGAIFAINFSNNFFDYTVAALKGWNKGVSEPEFDEDAFSSLEPPPILKNAWAAVICQIKDFDNDVLPVCKRKELPNTRADVLETHVFQFPLYFNNRAFNLAFEALILTNRIPFYTPYSSVFNKAIKNYTSIKKRLTDWREMERFENSFQVMDNFLIDHKIKAHDLFEL